MAMYNSGDIFAMFPRISVAYAMDFLQRERESVVLWQTLESIHFINICGYIQYIFGLRYVYIYIIYRYIYIYIFVVVVVVCCCDFRLGKFPPKIFQNVKATGASWTPGFSKIHGMYTARCNPWYLKPWKQETSRWTYLELEFQVPSTKNYPQGTNISHLGKRKIIDSNMPTIRGIC